MSAKQRTFILIFCDYIILLFSYFGCILLFPSLAGITAQNEILKHGIAFLMMLAVFPIIFRFFGVYKIIHRYAQSAEYLRFITAFFSAGIVYILVLIAFDAVLPAELYNVYFLITHTITAIVGMFFSRLIYRVLVNRANITKVEEQKAKNTLIIGCGQACLMLLNELKYHPESGIKPIVAVDKDPAKIGRSIAGVPIEDENLIESLCEKNKIELIIVAIPSADNKQRAKILERCSNVKAEIKMLPRVAEFNNTQSKVVDKLREFTMNEVLGRESIEITAPEVNSFIKGKTILVTGGGGSIGSELCRQIACNEPEKLIIVDIYENNAYEIEQELKLLYGKLLNLETIIASVRDYERINSIVAQHKPDIIIHAAAHKHVPLMENAPGEAIKNNVFGTYNAAKAAINNGVDKFILISTDKAVNPTNIMGASKRLCEMIIQSLNGHGTTFAAVRFGNVLGSNGSVIPLFKRQIANGGPVTVTHPDIIRFFMTIPEAVQLVLLAGTLAKGGEIFVLNMGEPVKIADLAKRIIMLSGKTPDVDIKIEYTGLRPGEKLYEELMMSDENLVNTENDKIFIGHFVDFDQKALESNLSLLKETAENNALGKDEMLARIEKQISELVPTFHRTV